MDEKPQLPEWAEYLLVFDTETTGVDVWSARIVSAAVALIGPDGEVKEEQEWLINPGIEIPARATQVHGISTETAVSSGVAAEVGISQISQHLRNGVERGYPIVAYNAPYDLSLLSAEIRRYHIDAPLPSRPVLDPLVIDKQLDRYRKGKRTLDLVSAHYGVALSDAHEAVADALAAGRVMQAIARRFARELPDTLDDVHDAQVRWAAEQAANFQEYMRRVRDPEFVAEGEWPIRSLA